MLCQVLTYAGKTNTIQICNTLKKLAQRPSILWMLTRDTRGTTHREKMIDILCSSDLKEDVLKVLRETTSRKTPIILSREWEADSQTEEWICRTEQEHEKVRNY